MINQDFTWKGLFLNIWNVNNVLFHLPPGNVVFWKWVDALSLLNILTSDENGIDDRRLQNISNPFIAIMNRRKAKFRLPLLLVISIGVDSSIEKKMRTKEGNRAQYWGARYSASSFALAYCWPVPSQQFPCACKCHHCLKVCGHCLLGSSPKPVLLNWLCKNTILAFQFSWYNIDHALQVDQGSIFFFREA